MGMGYGANYADVISEDFIKKTCPERFSSLKEMFKGEDLDMESFAQLVECQDLDETAEMVYDLLCDDFEEKTGLTLGLGYHDKQDEGDRYDDVDGSFWWVGNAYELSEAGKKYEKEINRKCYVSFG